MEKAEQNGQDTTPIAIKVPDTEYDIHPVIKKRWSPRAFSDRQIEKEQLLELFEAAGWAASAFNEQPWRYVYAFRGTPGFDRLWNCLSSGNRPWTKDAAVLIAVLQRNTLTKTGKVNHWATHDVGMANAQLLLQAAHRDIYGHLMAGFDKKAVTELLELDDDVQPVCMAALGYLGDPDQLDEPYRTRELTPRSRLPVDAFTEELDD